MFETCSFKAFLLEVQSIHALLQPVRTLFCQMISVIVKIRILGMFCIVDVRLDVTGTQLTDGPKGLIFSVNVTFENLYKLGLQPVRQCVAAKKPNVVNTL